MMKSLIKNIDPIAAILALIGGIAWLTTIYFQTSANAKDIADIRGDQKTYNEFVQQVDTRLSRIEGRLGIQSK